MKIFETAGIVLKSLDFKEKDCILTFLTRDFGKKVGILHGGKSIKSGNAAKSELFVLNHFEFSEKLNNDFVRIRKCDLLKSYPLLRRNYLNFLYANYFSELLLLPEIPENESKFFFDLLLNSILELSSPETVLDLKFTFELQFIKLLGIEPNLENCTQCDGEIWAKISPSTILPKFLSSYQFDARLGGLRCPKCLTGNKFASTLNYDSIVFFYSRQKRGQNFEEITPNTNILIELDQAFNLYFNFFFGKVLKSYPILIDNLWKK